ncbi:MAG: hypothetical protein Q8O88_00290 [bacterium]|nr:hypothetical protein [bacterium]
MLKMRHFSHWFLLLWLLIFINHTQAQSHVGKYDWLLPDYAKLQYAGGIGFLSAGVGYTFVHQRIDATFFYGYVPKGIAIDDLSSVSLQFTAKLVRIRLSENYQLLPLNFGWFIHHTFGSEYWIKLPSHYPPEYYWWSPGRNAGIFIGGELKTNWLARRTPASGIAVYARIGTRGLYLASKVGNSSIPITDIIELGFGIALYR